ncbi:hypothetical protein CDAR_240381 [Caerostris darwini]|uniref:Uncharacterized protein n=1 Tax=Caerostris darwini TaxID=1538125 RepID=A0AAV4RJM9_9ARAC|nr:hypothetical protein CDAR_240381 [Caerostris darwini]
MRNARYSYMSCELVSQQSQCVVVSASRIRKSRAGYKIQDSRVIQKEILDCSYSPETFFDQVDISKLLISVLEQSYFNYLYWTSCRINLITEKNICKNDETVQQKK